MTRVVVDASALAAVAFCEPEGEAVLSRLDGATVFAPSLLRYELASVARKKCRQQPADAPKILTALARVLDERTELTWHDVSPVDVVLIAHEMNTSTYDASYVWLAGFLEADLVTLDVKLARTISALRL